jgi:hypothetical protein
VGDQGMTTRITYTLICNKGGVGLSMDMKKDNDETSWALIDKAKKLGWQFKIVNGKRKSTVIHTCPSCITPNLHYPSCLRYLPSLHPATSEF